jgi:hypothetical protein
MRFAYADPPYPGQSKTHYEDHPDYAGEVEHPALVEQLVAEYPDGWALSTTTGALRWLLPLCPEDTRVLAWVKPFCSWKPGVAIAHAWEPVLFVGGRNRYGEVQTGRDWVAASPPVFTGEHKRIGDGTKGQKPLAFCYWLFDLFGAVEGDELLDLFPGSGAVGWAWQAFFDTPRIPFPSKPENVQLDGMEAA